MRFAPSRRPGCWWSTAWATRRRPWGLVLGEAEPRGEPSAIALQALVEAVFQGKAYPALAFPFGLSLALSTSDGQRRSLAAARRRLLLLIGVLHGAFLYFGDILTSYAMCGMLALRDAHRPWSRLRLRPDAAWAMATAVSGLTLALVAIGLPADGAATPTSSTVDGCLPFLWLSASGCVTITVLGLLSTLPLLYLCTLAGMDAARLRLLTHRRWPGAWESCLRRWLWLLVVVNALYGLGAALTSVEGAPALLAVESAVPLVGVPMSALLLARASRRHWALETWMGHAT